MTPSARTILQALKTKDFHSANEAFARVMNQKIADRLVAERKGLVKESLASEPSEGDAVRQDNDAEAQVKEDTFGAKVKAKVKTGIDNLKKALDSHLETPDDVDSRYARSDKPNKFRTEATLIGNEMPAHEVQRVFDLTGDELETEVLCGVKQLRVNSNGQVVSFVAEEWSDEARAKAAKARENASQDTHSAIAASKKANVDLPQHDEFMNAGHSKAAAAHHHFAKHHEGIARYHDKQKKQWKFGGSPPGHAAHHQQYLLHKGAQTAHEHARRSHNETDTLDKKT